MLPLYSAMLNVPRDQHGGGAGPRRRPVPRPAHRARADGAAGLRTAFAFSFLLAAGDFVTPSLVGGTQSLLIGNIIADQFRGIGSNWPLGAAMAFVVVAVDAALLSRRHPARSGG